jgi:adenylate kinase
MSKIIVLMGAPGAGKGTQARLLQERLHLPQISTGDIFRALKHADTPLAREVREIMQRGQLVPDEVTTELVKERTAWDDAERRLHSRRLFRVRPRRRTSLERLAAEQGQTDRAGSDRSAVRST